MKFKICCHIIALLFSIFAAPAFAHQFSTAYFNGAVDEIGVLRADLQLGIGDLNAALNLDLDSNGEITWREVLTSENEINRFISEGLRIQRSEELCGLKINSQWKADQHFNETYLQLPLQAQCSLSGDLSIKYTALFPFVTEHKLIVNFRENENQHSRVISESNKELLLLVDSGSAWLSFVEYLRQGIIHIWIGLDHILFLLCLMMACVFQRRKNLSAANESLTQALQSSGILTFKVVTAFTISHSITLAATALDWIQFPSRWVEFVIALSVAIAAAALFFPRARSVIALSFGFGLLHGMGFAGVLGELGLPADVKLPSVLAFNIGVEFGQLMIVLVILPLLVLIYRCVKQPQYIRYAGASAILVFAGLWLLDRFPM